MTAIREITPEQAHASLDDYHVVDVRHDHEHRGPLGHIEDASLVPLPELEARAAELPDERPLLLVCRSGKRSAAACSKLRELGRDAVVNLAGGMIAWRRAGLPVRSHPPESLEELLEQLIAWMAQVSPLTAEGAREQVAGRMALAGASLASPTPDAVARTLDFVEQSLADSGAPADLDLSLAAFRSALGRLSR